jgi:hypothetical protein
MAGASVEIGPRLLSTTLALFIGPALVLALLSFVRPLVLLQAILLLFWYPIAAHTPRFAAPLLYHGSIQEFGLYVLACIGALRLGRAHPSAARKKVLVATCGAFAALTLLGTLALPYSPGIPQAGYFIRAAFLAPLALALCVFAFARTIRQVWLLAATFVLGSALFALVLSILWATGHVAGTANTAAGARLGGLLSLGPVSIYWDPVALGSVLGVCLPFSLGLMLRGGSRFAQLFFGISSATIAFALIASGTRGGMIGAAAGFVVLLALSGRVRPRAVLALASSAAFIGVFLTQILRVQSTNSVIASRLSSLSAITQDRNFQGRQHIWATNWHDVLNHALLPVGFSYDPTTGGGNPHNYYLFVGLGTGLLGIGLCVCLLVFFALKLWRRAPSCAPGGQAVIWAAGGALAALLVAGWGDALFMDVWQGLAVFTPIVVGVAARTAASEQSIAPSVPRAEGSYRAPLPTYGRT